jgi:hypothetical protein
MLQINNIWITSHFKRELYKARRTTPMEEYLKTKYNWSNRTLNDIYWPSIKTVRQQLSQTKRMQSTDGYQSHTCANTSPESTNAPDANAQTRQ